MNEDHHHVGRPSGEGRTTIDRAELRKRAEGATKGEWSYLREPGMVVCTLGRATPVPVFLRGSMAKHEDGQFAVAAQPQVVLALLDRVEELKAAVAPFARLGDEAAWMEKPDDKLAWGFDGVNLSWGDFHRARKALSGEKQ